MTQKYSEGLDTEMLGRRSFVKRAALAGGTIAFGGGLLAACGSDDEGAAGDGADLKNVKLGYSLPVTGPLAATFSTLFVPADMAIEEINGKDAVTYRQKSFDDKGDPSQIPAVFRRASQEGYNFVIGPNSSSTTLAAMPIATKLKILHLGAAVAPEIGDPTKNPYSWQFNANAELEAQVVVDLLKSRGIRRAGMLQADDAFGEAMHDASVKYLKDAGIELTSVQKLESLATNTTPYLRRLREDGAEAILQWQTVAAAIAATYKSLHNMNWNPMCVGHCSVLTTTAYEAAPSSVTDNVYGQYLAPLTWTDSEDIGQAQKDYVKKLEANTGNLGGQETVIGVTPTYDFIYALTEAIQKAGTTDVEKVNATLEGMGDWDGLLGSYNLNADSHSALKREATVMASLGSAKDDRAQNWFRERVE